MILLFVLASGEEEAFAYLYSHYKGLMLQKAYAILHDRMLAEDAVSEAFLRIYRNRHKVDDPASDRSLSFVMTIVRNTALTLYNRERRQPPKQIGQLLGIRENTATVRLHRAKKRLMAMLIKEGYAVETEA